MSRSKFYYIIKKKSIGLIFKNKLIGCIEAIDNDSIIYRGGYLSCNTKKDIIIHFSNYYNILLDYKNIFFITTKEYNKYCQNNVLRGLNEE